VQVKGQGYPTTTLPPGTGYKTGWALQVLWLLHRQKKCLSTVQNQFLIFRPFDPQAKTQRTVNRLVPLQVQQQLLWHGTTLLCYKIIHSIGMCRMRWFPAVLRSFFHSSLSYTFSCHSSPPTMLPSSLTSSCHLFLGLPLGLVVSKFIHNTLLGIPFSSILCTCSNQRNLCNLIVSVIVGFLTIA